MWALSALSFQNKHNGQERNELTPQTKKIPTPDVWDIDSGTE